MEEKLKESEEHFRLLFNTMVDPVVIVDKKGIFLDVTDRVKEVTGYKKEELIGKSFLKTDIITEKSKLILIKNLTERTLGKKVVPYEVEVLTKNGKKIPFEVNAAIINYKGKTADMVVFRDITERKKMEEKLKESKTNLKLILNSVPDSIIIIDWRGNLLYANPAAYKLVGIKSSKRLGKINIKDFLHSKYKLAAFKDLMLVKLGRGGFLGLYKIITRSGKEKFVEGIGTKIKFNEKFADLVVLRDVTNRIKMENELKREKEKFEKYLNVVGNAIVALDANGKITLINKSGREILGYKEGELIGKDWFETCIPDEKSFQKNNKWKNKKSRTL